MRIRRGLVALALVWALGVQAADYAVVDAIQPPAWLERGSQRLALVPGMALDNRDRLVTGHGGRAIINLADGSAAKIGQDASLGLNALGRRQGGVFTAALDVAGGAFRLTTDIFRRYASKRAINVRIGTVTAGIRGTDIWGKSDTERDFVCLLEGRIVASHPLGEAVALSEPLQYYGAAKGQAPGAVASITPEEVAAWARETELQAGAGSLRRGGRWTVSLAALDTEAAALSLYDRAAVLGYGAKIRPRSDGAGGYRYEVKIGLVSNETEARALAARLERELELAAPPEIRH